MLSLHVVKCIIEWRKQLIYNFLITNQPNGTAPGGVASPGNQMPKNNIKKFKNIPFLWENENYLLKMKSDTTIALYNSHFAKYINFSSKNDPFLVFPSSKHHETKKSVVQGGGMAALKKLKNGG